MTTWQLLASAWIWDPTVIFGCAALVGAYAWATGFRITRQVLTFGSGVLVLLFALVSPLDVLGDTYLFSAHMLQHLLLIEVVPPLLILGLTRDLVTRVLRWKSLCALERFLTRPLLAWLLGIGTLWLWHVPSLYNLALMSDFIHVGQHLSFLITGTMFWWPVLGVYAPHRLSAPAALVYLMAAAMASTLLGILLAYWPAFSYSPYQHPVDSLHILSLIRQGWGVTAGRDQEIGGLLMWFPGSVPYISCLLGMTFQWLDSAETNV
ncbi:MAG: cytochrome c oxidase assembly protein [Acidobacteriota bacterium]